MASKDYALRNLGVLASLFESLVTFGILWELRQLITPVQSARRDVPVVDPYARNVMLPSFMSSSLFSKPPPHYALATPTSVREVVDPVVLDLCS